MRSALVTGATGFIGAALVRALLASGWDVQAVGRRPAAVRTHLLDIEDVSRDGLLDLLKQSGCDVVFHLAGTASGAEASLERVNVGFAKALLEAAALAPRRPSVVLAGTAAEYGEVSERDLPVREDHPCHPATPYAASKLRQTQLGLAAAAKGQTVYLPRLFNVVGCGMRPHLALGRFAREVLALGKGGGVLTTGRLDAYRDFIALDDAVRVLIGLSQSPAAAGRVVNLCSGVPLRMDHMLDALLQATDVPVRLEIDTALSGVSAVPCMYGCTRRLASLGFTLAVPDVAAEMARLLNGYDDAMMSTAC
nr:NAD-dependent epimerase/dehydratase family protein [uncultured Roseococcus sp.]